MKNLMMIFAGAILSTTVAFANESVDPGAELSVQDNTELSVQEIEAINQEPVMSEADVAPLATEIQTYKSGGGAVVGGVVGGIIGAIVADEWDRGDRPRRGRIATCFAENRRGQVFRASSRWAREAQRTAMNKCLRVSRGCRALGCR